MELLQDLEDLSVILPLEFAYLVPPFDLLLSLVVDPVLLLPHEREVPLHVAVGARAALGGQTDAVVHREAEGSRKYRETNADFQFPSTFNVFISIPKCQQRLRASATANKKEGEEGNIKIKN